MAGVQTTERAPRNRTQSLTAEDRARHEGQLLVLARDQTAGELSGKTICQDMEIALKFLPRQFVDLLFLDPPYNLTKTFNTVDFKGQTTLDYSAWFASWFVPLLPVLKPSASVYICGDWRSCAAIQMIAEKYLRIRNRITWEREKGRGAKSNWKNCAEDIWFCTVSDDYYFNAEAVRLKRRVIAPYTDGQGPRTGCEPEKEISRLTSPSNLWTDLTVPFWSMPENTEHPTQKPEKLLAKVLLASSQEGDLVLDPFLGSGTTSVVAKKLGRRYLGIEADKEYATLAEKRLACTAPGDAIQGYRDGVFWERNSFPYQRAARQDAAQEQASIPGLLQEPAQ